VKKKDKKGDYLFLKSGMNAPIIKTIGNKRIVNNNKMIRSFLLLNI
jgi:hypothetical protein